MIIDNNSAITSFWQWFAVTADHFILDTTNKTYISQLNQYLDAIDPSLDWEIGLADPSQQSADTPMFLAISPCLQEEKLTVTKQIIQQAPACNGWAFLPAKPKKEWTDIFYMTNEHNHKIEVSTRDWKYQLYLFDDETFDADIWINNVPENANTQYLAAEIALTNILGEEYYMQQIKNINITRKYNEEWSSFKFLGHHLESLTIGSK